MLRTQVWVSLWIPLRSGSRETVGREGAREDLHFAAQRYARLSDELE